MIAHLAGTNAMRNFIHDPRSEGRNTAEEIARQDAVDVGFYVSECTNQVYEEKL